MADEEENDVFGFTCHWCGKSFRKWSGLEAHFRFCKKYRIAKGKIDPPRYKCQGCGMIYEKKPEKCLFCTDSDLKEIA